jgi:membrane protein implicated in regulation of membrane protease activity
MFTHQQKVYFLTGAFFAALFFFGAAFFTVFFAAGLATFFPAEAFFFTLFLAAFAGFLATAFLALAGAFFLATCRWEAVDDEEPTDETGHRRDEYPTVKINPNDEMVIRKTNGRALHLP